MTIKKLHTIIIGGLLLTCTYSCDVTDFSENLNAPESVSPQSILPHAEFMSFTHNDLLKSSLSMRFMVQTGDGSKAQMYDWDRGNFDEYNHLRNVQKVIDESGEDAKNKAYVAVGKIMRAHNFFNLTCMYGDVPYSQALKGENQDINTSNRFYPAYDAQKDVLLGILNELKEANQLLKEYPDASLENDIIYEGDLSKWRKAANSYQLRILLMMSKKASDQSLGIPKRFQEIVENPTEYPIFSTFTDQLQIKYLNSDGVTYPLYNDIDMISKRYIGKEICDLLKELQDPRLFIYAEPSEKSQEENPANAQYDFNNYQGVDATLPLNDINVALNDKTFSRINRKRYSQTQEGEPSVVLSYAEVMYALAEAYQLGWITSINPQKCYEEGIKASFSFYGLDNYYEQYIQNKNVSYNQQKALLQIYQQRYIIYMMQNDYMSLFQYHRTGYPEMKCGKGQITNQVPFRMRYPLNEVNMNHTHHQEALNNQGFAEDNEMCIPWLYQ